MKKPKMVKAWCYAVMSADGPDVYANMSRRIAVLTRRSTVGSDSGLRVGPIVRIEVPAPKERKR